MLTVGRRVLVLLSTVLSGLYLTGCDRCDSTERKVICAPHDCINDPQAQCFEEVCCDNGKHGSVCCLERAASYVSGLKTLPLPDLSYTNVDGPVDYGVSYLKVDIPDLNDSLRVAITGRVAMKGGVCATPPCPLEVALLELYPQKGDITTKKGRPVSGFVVRNLNNWTGTRQPNNLIILDERAQLGIEAVVDQKPMVAVLKPHSHFQGHLFYDVTRDTGTKRVENNLLEVEGMFTDGTITAEFQVNTWLTDCTPIVLPRAECRVNIESGRPMHLHLDSDFELMATLQASQDLCDAMLADKVEKWCKAGRKSDDDANNTTFRCGTKLKKVPQTKVEIAKHLDFRWTDALGKNLGNTHVVYVDHENIPVFPLTLEVKNRWGKVVRGFVTSRPDCVPPTLDMAEGRITFLRAHALGSGYGAPPYELPAEVIVRLDGAPDLTLGMELRDNAQGPSNRGIFEHLRDAFEHGRAVRVEYEVKGPHIGMILRVLDVSG